MRDIGGTYENGERAREAFLALALQAVERLAAQRCEGVGVLNKDLLDRIIELATSPDEGAGSALLETLRAAKVPGAQIADLYLPCAARAFGEGWIEDRLTFSQVTVGTARLQELLHHIDDADAPALPAPPGVRTALILVPPGEQHTLGPILLGAALRRRGISVSLQFAPSIPDLSRLLVGRTFDVAFISLGSTDRLETCLKLVRTLKQLTKGQLCIAIGGAALESCTEALASSGADLVTNDVERVLAELAREEGGITRERG